MNTLLVYQLPSLTMCNECMIINIHRRHHFSKNKPVCMYTHCMCEYRQENNYRYIRGGQLAVIQNSTGDVQVATVYRQH